MWTGHDAASGRRLQQKSAAKTLRFSIESIEEGCSRHALEELRETLQDVTRSPRDFDRPALRPPKRRTRRFEPPTEIEFARRKAPPETRINLSTSDHPGLPWTVGRALDPCQVRITQARITTLGAQAQDVFTVADADEPGLPGGEFRQKVPGGPCLLPVVVKQVANGASGSLVEIGAERGCGV